MIKTWQQRCEEHPDHEGIVSYGMVQARMQEEIDDLREALEEVEELREALKAELERTFTDEQISDLWHQSGEQPFKFARMILGK